AVRSAEPSLAQLLWTMKAHLQFLLDHTAYLRMILHDGHAWYHAAAQPTRDEREIWERGIGVIQNVLQWGHDQGLLTGGSTPDQARMLLTLQQTRLANWVLDGMRAPHDAVIGLVLADFIRHFARPAVAREAL